MGWCCRVRAGDVPNRRRGDGANGRTRFLWGKGPSRVEHLQGKTGRRVYSAVITPDDCRGRHPWVYNAEFQRPFRLRPNRSMPAALHNGLRRTGRLGYATPQSNVTLFTIHFSALSPGRTVRRRWLLDQAGANFRARGRIRRGTGSIPSGLA
jgi:hypothetical protein